MKRIELWSKSFYLTIIASALVLTSFAQPGTNIQKLQELSLRFKQRAEMNKKEATAFARKNNIPLKFQTPEGRLFELMEIKDGKPMYYLTDNSTSASTISTNNVHPGGSAGLSLDGTGMTVHEWDGGAVLASHQEFNGRVTMGDGVTTTHYHATHVAGTLIASGVVSSAKGMAPNASLRAFDWNSDESEMAVEGGNGALVSNHSYGYGRGWVWTGTNYVWYGNTSISTQEDYLFGFYDSQAQDWDQIAYNAPNYLIVKSAGNDRGDGPTNGAYPQDGPYDCISHAGIAKNILTVGAVNDIPGGYSGPSSVVMSSFSSWGPADDGRIKPDISTNGVGLYSTDDDNNSDYTSLSGTSMAAPSATGSLILLQQHYEAINGTGNFMRASTLKALVIATADEAGANDGPDYSFGWGLMNTEKAALKISEDQVYNVIDEQVLNNGDAYSFNVNSDGTEPLTVTICWTDPAGTPVSASLDPSDIQLVNDLDLRITKDGSTFYPYKLDPNNPNNPATNTSENNVDNAEMVRIADPSAGTYTVTIDHDGTLAVPQHYSIIIDGAIFELPDPPVADFSGNATNINEGQSVSFTDASLNNPTSWSWSFPGGIPETSNQQNPTVQYLQQGTYNVSLTVSNAAGTDTKVLNSYITVTAQAPVAGFTVSSNTVTEGGEVTFTDQSQNYPDTYQWTFEGGTPNSSTDPSPTITYNTQGTYNVTLVVANEAGNDTFSDVITVEEATYCASSGNTSAEYISSIAIDNVSISDIGDDGGYKEPAGVVELNLEASSTVSISLAPGFTGRPSHQYWAVWIDYNQNKVFEAAERVFAPSKNRGTVTGTFTTAAVTGTTRMRVSMSDSGTPDPCGPVGGGEVEDFLIAIGEAQPDPLIADFTAITSTSILVGESVSFEDRSNYSPDSYSWVFDGGVANATDIANPVVTYNQEGTFAVSLTVTKDAETDTETKTDYITVTTYTPPTDYCIPQNLTSFKDDFIKQISIGADVKTYNSFTGYSVPVGMNVTTGVNTIKLSPNVAKNRNFWGVWINLSTDDFDFDDPGETLLLTDVVKGDYVGTIEIPANADGKRMRIVMQTLSAPAPCSDNFNGEVKDFTINVSPSALKGANIISLTPVDDEFSFKVYPNPASGRVFIKTSGWSGDKSIALLNTLGQTVYQKNHSEQLIGIDVSDLPKGLYILHVNGNTKRQLSKVLIE